MPPALMQPAIPQHSCCRQREIKTLSALRRCKELCQAPNTPATARNLVAQWTSVAPHSRFNFLVVNLIKIWRKKVSISQKCSIRTWHRHSQLTHNSRPRISNTKPYPQYAGPLSTYGQPTGGCDEEANEPTSMLHRASALDGFVSTI
jgi:hypothetical protein